MSDRRRWIRRAVAAGATVGVIGAVCVSISFTPIFDAEQILVHGTRYLDPATVRRIAGLERGTNVIHTDLAAAIVRLERIGWVADATASRSLPDTIVLEVRERVPVGVIPGEGGSVVMADGTIVQGGAVSGLTRIWVRGGAAAPSATIRSVAAALGAIPGPIRSQVRGASARADGVIILQLRGGVGVIVGRPRELRPKAAALEQLLAWAERGHVRLTSIDLTVPQAPAVRTAGGVDDGP